MKNVIPLLLISIFLACCKDRPQPQPTTDEVVYMKQKLPEGCGFGLEKKEFKKSQRSLSKQEKQKGKDPLKQPGKGKPKPSPGPPSSAAVFLLDFDGHIVKNTNWNYIPEIVCSHSNLTHEQQQKILDMVALRYADYNVLVTTDTLVYASANPNKRMRCVITESFEWFGNGAGGVSLINSLTWGNDTPCFVFSNLLGFSTKKIQEAAVHELGHTIGLYHQSAWTADCIKTAEYRIGFIMGNPYTVDNPGFTVGPDSRACPPVDEIKILKSKL